MTTFLRLLHDTDKAVALVATSGAVRKGGEDSRVFSVKPEAFQDVPGAPFAYWVTGAVRETFKRLPAYSSSGREAQVGASTKDDFRFLRLWWEEEPVSESKTWFEFAKGGAFSPYYADVYLCIQWKDSARELEAAILKRYPYLGDSANWVLHRESNYFRPGLTWPRRTNGFSVRVLPRGCVFADKGPSAFVSDDSPIELLALAAVLNSRTFLLLLSLQLARTELAQSFEVGLVQQTPVPSMKTSDQRFLSDRAGRSWSLKRALDTVSETSHAFVLPVLLRPRVGPYDPLAIETELARIQSEVDDICFDLYGFDEADRAAMTETTGSVDEGTATERDEDHEDADDADEEDVSADTQSALLSWCVGAAFGRFDWRLATGERKAPPEPGPFDTLPPRSPGMLPDGVEPLYAHAGILVDDKGELHDLPHLIEEVLMKVNIPVPGNVREWLRHDFFAFHLQHYSKSRRKAPIYWPLSTRSGDYTLWVYYPSLTDQTLYIAVNEFVEPKLKQVAAQLAALGAKGSKRTHEEEKKLEELQNTEDELTDLCDALLKIAPTYHPNQDDGVQITAAPLWPLFHHKPWQKLLKETWAKLEKGDYDWAHLAMHYWPDRVRAKCTTDKSLSIAHGLEDLYVEPERHERTPRSRRQ